MRKKLVAANWKMHGSRSMAAALCGEIVAAGPGGIDVVVCPPFPYLDTVAAACVGEYEEFEELELTNLREIEGW